MLIDHPCRARLGDAVLAVACVAHQHFCGWVLLRRRCRGLFLVFCSVLFWNLPRQGDAQAGNDRGIVEGGGETRPLCWPPDDLRGLLFLIMMGLSVLAGFFLCPFISGAPTPDMMLECLFCGGE